MGRTESKGYNPGVDPWTIPKSNGFQNQHLTSQCAIGQHVFGLDRFQNLICNLMKMMKPASKKQFGKKVGLFVSFKASSIRLPNKSGGPVLSCLFKVVTFSPFTNLEGPWAIWKSRWDKVTAECATLRSQQVMTTAMQSETKVWTQDLC